MHMYRCDGLVCICCILLSTFMAVSIIVNCVIVHAQVAESKFLNNRLVDVVAFMENIAVKDSSEKVIL